MVYAILVLLEPTKVEQEVPFVINLEARHGLADELRVSERARVIPGSAGPQKGDTAAWDPMCASDMSGAEFSFGLIE
jgi:hypothetical protein